MHQDKTFNNTHQTFLDDKNYISDNSMEESSDVKIGLVDNCKKLNVREGPGTNFSVVCEVVSKTELMIDEKESTDDFYKICTSDGIEGFCMKKFIAVQP